METVAETEKHCDKGQIVRMLWAYTGGAPTNSVSEGCGERRCSLSET